MTSQPPLPNEQRVPARDVRAGDLLYHNYRPHEVVGTEPTDGSWVRLRLCDRMSREAKVELPETHEVLVGRRG